MKEQLQNAAKLILLVLILVIAVMITECERSKAACKAVELMPGYHTPVVIRGELSLAYTELVRMEVIGTEKDETGKIEKKDAAERQRPRKKKHTDAELLAEVMYHENWYTDPKHLAARWTGAVVLNRVKSDRWPNTISEVLYQNNPRQYSTTGKFFTVELPEGCYEMACEIIKNGAPEVPENVVYQSQFMQGSGLWQEKNGEYFCYE